MGYDSYKHADQNSVQGRVDVVCNKHLIRCQHLLIFSRMEILLDCKMTDIGRTHALALECSRSKIRMEDIEWLRSSREGIRVSFELRRSVMFWDVLTPIKWSDRDTDGAWCVVIKTGVVGSSITTTGRSWDGGGSSHFRMLLCDLHKAAFTKHADCTDDAYV